jgi:hypothetical protein
MDFPEPVAQPAYFIFIMGPIPFGFAQAGKHVFPMVVLNAWNECKNRAWILALENGN